MKPKTIKTIIGQFDGNCRRVYGTCGDFAYGYKISATKRLLSSCWPNRAQSEQVEAASKFLDWFFVHKALLVNRPTNIAMLAEYFHEYEGWIKRNTFSARESWHDAVRRDNRELESVSIAMTGWDEFLSTAHQDELAI
jgi:hypothetical protein